MQIGQEKHERDPNTGSRREPEKVNENRVSR